MNAIASLPSSRPVMEAVRIMATGLKPGLVTQLLNLTRDLHLARIPQTNIIAIVRPLIEEIRKETRACL